MKKLMRIGAKLNGFKLQFDDSLLNEIRESYQQYLHSYLTHPQNQHLFEGGTKLKHAINDATNEYFLISYQKNPLLWISANTSKTYQIYKKFFDALDIEEDIKSLVDYDKKIVMYAGFLVIGNRATEHAWHVDYDIFANGYTLLTPLYELDQSHGNLLYKTNDAKIEIYPYKLREAIIFGHSFIHSTELYNRTNQMRILISITFGTDKLKYWNSLKKTIESQSKYLVLPCGHRIGSCQCID